jgi:hypothetical protein
MKFSLITLLLVFPFILFSQKKGTTFGFQIKPIIPVNYFNAGPQTVSDSLVEINIKPKTGFSFGVLIRQEISKSIAIEAGISSVKRNYDVEAKGLTDNRSDKTDFSFLSYQIPIQGLFYIQLSEQIFMNTTAGVGIDMYPSDIKSKGENFLLNNQTSRFQNFNLSLLANLGFEYRTEKNGTFYIGASFNGPFKAIAKSFYTYNYVDSKNTTVSSLLNGNYITLDLRFFFPEQDDKK